MFWEGEEGDQYLRLWTTLVWPRPWGIPALVGHAMSDMVEDNKLSKLAIGSPRTGIRYSLLFLYNNRVGRNSTWNIVEIIP
jgi:hypothetical protein